ncbi:hypothetical protein [Effusibacillus consociatus]|uniref:Uncharacterized protein n=1 Tax=Effusibacillus consociatus TaxID=1117041 RepID=A0ABV9Q5Q7_9BACL
MSKVEQHIRTGYEVPVETEKRAITPIEWIGLGLVAIVTLLLIAKPDLLGGVFTAMLNKVKPIVVDVFLMGTVGVAIILSVMTGRMLERMGFTDALMRLDGLAAQSSNKQELLKMNRKLQLPPWCSHNSLSPVLCLV